MAAPSGGGGGGGGGAGVGGAGALLVLALGLWGAWSGHQDGERFNEARRARLERQAASRSANPSPSTRSTPAPRDRKVTQNGLERCAGSKDLIVKVGTEHDLPSGLLYAVWNTESNALCSGHGDAGSWKVPTELMENGGCVTGYMRDDYARCARRTSGACSKEELEQRTKEAAVKCANNFAALKVVCAQTRDTPNGPRPICDPSSVRTSWAFAMGLMQILPTALFRLKDGAYVRTDIAVDYDGDGVVDPHSLPDALASAAKLLKRKHANAAKEKPKLDAYALWEYAANLYYGEIESNYYSGTDVKRGARSYWGEWCALTGTCTTRRVAYATR